MSQPSASRPIASSDALYIDSEYHLISSRTASFRCGVSHYTGRTKIPPDLYDRLQHSADSFNEYGSHLFDALFPKGSELRVGYRESMARAIHEERCLRFRLHLDSSLPLKIHALSWELLYDSSREIRLGQSPDLAFSRYRAVPQAAAIPISGKLRVLCAISAPSDAEDHRMAEIVPEETEARLRGALEPLEGKIELEFLNGPATPGRISEKLSERRFHALYVFGHGLVHKDSGQAFLVLQENDGRARFVDEKLLSSVLLGRRHLHLVTLMACHGGAPSSTDTFSGLAGRLVERGLPAIIAMRRTVTFDDAYLFSEHFYRSLASKGRVDVASNWARHQLYLEQPENLAWSSPMLFMRLTDGKFPVVAEDSEIEEQSLATETNDTTRDSRIFPTSRDERVSFVQRFPRGPAVDAELLPLSIVDCYVSGLTVLDSKRVLHEANKLRCSADPEIPAHTLKIGPLADPLVVGLAQYWFEIFTHALLRGPRMLMALLVSAPPLIFDGIEDQVQELLDQLGTWRR